MLKTKEFTYHQLDQLPLHATAYLSSKPSKNKTILYFHGGGLIYGSRVDLPNDYLSSFLDAGYHVISFDYPLAPESTLQDIYASVKEAVKWFVEKSTHTLSIQSSDYILFGRSAGAYLCFLLAKDSSLPSPKAIINFYGYGSLDYSAFHEPSPYYSGFSKVPKSMVDRLIQDKPIAKGPLHTRYALYLYARQTGKWLDLLNLPKSKLSDFSLTTEEAKALPQTFIAHSKEDTDVPYTIALQLSQEIPQSYLYTVNGQEHDFDRKAEAQEAKEAYSALLHWLETHSSN